MITLGIDLSSSKDLTVACAIEWKKKRAIVASPALRCTDDDLDKLISKANVIGIDAPFGWPVPFVEAVSEWTETIWSPDVRKRLQFRVTDRQVQEKTGIWPLSVSTDRIALPAMRAMALLQRYKVTDRSGYCKFFEVYPAATLKTWGLDSRGYKRIDEECVTLRHKILSQLRQKLPWLEVSTDYAKTSDALDALIASLTVRAAYQKLTIKPTRSQVTVARREGWIHLPTGFPTL